MATAQLMGDRHDPDHVATWIANITCGTPMSVRRGRRSLPTPTGRFLSGLASVISQSRAWGSTCQEPQAALRRYVTAVRSWLRGKGQHHIRSGRRPIRAGLCGGAGLGRGRAWWRVADASCLSVVRRTCHKSKVWAAVAVQAPDLAPLDLTLRPATFLGNDLEAMAHAARQNLELFTTFPFLPAAVPGHGVY